MTGTSSQTGSIIDETAIVRENENLRGIPLSVWMMRWLDWLHSASVRYHNFPGEVLFTRGAVTYKDLPDGRRVQDITYYNRDEDEATGAFLGDNISNETPIYVDVLPSWRFVGETYDQYNLSSIEECLYAVSTDSWNSNGFYCTLEKLKEDGQKIGEFDLRPYVKYVETPVNFIVHPKSELAQAHKTKVTPGDQAIGAVGGFMLFIRNLKVGTYVLSAGGIGTEGYITNYRHRLIVREDNGSNLFTNVEKLMKAPKSVRSPVVRSQPPKNIQRK